PSRPLQPCPARGSSARAEIHPDREQVDLTPLGLLRTRGDSPDSRAPLWNLNRAPPHARRFTPISPALVACHLGSSARAEIHPRSTASWRSRPGLLRTRGDSPISLVGVTT